MKTLDEVIFEAPYSPTPWEADALNYLKKYQRDKQIFAYDIAKRNMELSERNDPLTIDDMKNMNGEPVWDSNNGRWYLIHWVDDDHLTAYLYSDEGVQVWRDDDTLKAKPMYRIRQ